MPYINVSIAAEKLSEELVTSVSNRISDVMSSILNKDAALVSVAVNAVPPQQWHVAKEMQKEGSTAFVEAFITQGTNTPEQKAEAQKAMFACLTQELGELNEASYIVLNEIPANDWGYGGRMQASRKHGIQRTESGEIDSKFYRFEAKRLQAKEIRRYAVRAVSFLSGIFKMPRLLRIEY